jgi:hypothetical protein
LEDEVRDLQVLPAAAVRARGRRRKRQQMAAVMVGVAVVATTAGITATRVLDRTERGTAVPGPATADIAVRRCVVTLPDGPARVRVRVLDGGAPAGLGKATAAELRERRFTVVTGTGGPTSDPAGPTTLGYGPATIGAAELLRAELSGGAVMRFDPARADDIVDLTLGTTFTRLATSTEVNQALVSAGEPSAPPGC